ncbi:hypothetical protein [Ferrimicrobium acidiphilum]|uniref:Tyrosine recombinase XerC n=1 Tax=Ferrimicrobium acidiphilum DSM 19497 TaxID=1121877 RepID=A0A0D8FXE9_9ACTN|nr:hypothetical protein [Ferrimicrobium acidiphilum]KJE77943.1 hypothetical protein FEAC_03150 [Ferrimicrobium acidiphilum DSM 19497]
MVSSVRVIRPVAVDPEVIERVLGVTPHEVEHVDAPSILVDGEFHVAASRWLLRKYRLRPVEATIKSHAARLALYIAWLRNDCGLAGNDQWYADVFVVSEEQVRRYYRLRQFDPKTRVSSSAWQAQLSTIKQFHEFLRDTYRVPLPFHIESFLNPVGMRVTSATELRPRMRDGSRGTPITPEFSDLLIQGALRIDGQLRQTDSLTVERDAAFISLGLATGMRSATLASITAYELPPLGAGPLTTIRVPDFITKGDAGGDALVFAHRLVPVHQYIHGARDELIGMMRAPYSPIDAIELVGADSDAWETTVDGKVRRFTWVETDMMTRRRLVLPDGTSPLLWYGGYKAKPISYAQAATITAMARDWTRAHLEPNFPASFRTHDLRHTYATHLVVCIYKQAVAQYIHESAADAYRPGRIADAVSIAKLSLGHASEASTNLYIQHAPKFLDISIDEFLGGK